ncbi:hypothetical protein AVEN_84942-1 [Araneus ventricosus]|uniref:RNase H type-1 domain-containing protein n=1 Tax=Araneus ventricosus TaxID=182803 RepID=A0A4Y2C0F4_ARAVE|nr:hypothetical protein AVEN_84942-1 [Araneus ventricosus]
MATRNLQLFWVRAHVGVIGNEAADRYAKEATARPAVDMELLKTASEFQREARSELLSLWQTRWVQSETGRQTAKFFPLVDLVPKLYNSHIMQIITGHGRFPHYFKRFNISDNDTCRCGSFGDANHYITDCRYTTDLRSRLRFDRDYPPSLFEAVTNLPVLNDLMARVAGLLPNLYKKKASVSHCPMLHASSVYQKKIVLHLLLVAFCCIYCSLNFVIFDISCYFLWFSFQDWFLDALCFLYVSSFLEFRIFGDLIKVEELHGPQGSVGDVGCPEGLALFYGPVGSVWEWPSEGRRRTEDDDYGHVTVST